ncbi:MAG: hypothetical protein IH861_04520 [Chloroflexi bacterium]|nr:hypothetical protein [Chloroflexota bacterium]
MTSIRDSSLEEIVAEVINETANRQPGELGLVENLLTCCLRGLSQVGTFTRTTENHLQFALLLLATRSFNSLRCASELLKQGYYIQSLTLVRSASEDNLVALDCENNPATLEALLGNVGRLGKGKLTYTEMAKRQGDDFYNAWKYNYGVLSEYAAHSRENSLKVLIDPETHNLVLASRYDRELFVGVCDALLAAAIGTSDIIAKVLGHEAQRWQSETLPKIKAAHDWRKKIKDIADSDDGLLGPTGVI